MRKIVLPRLVAAIVKLDGYKVHGGGWLSGAFQLVGPCSRLIRIISSGVDPEHGWEHVSVSTERHIPNWIEMCFVKDLFWEEEECVVQFHPPKSQWVNVHPNCLHMWKPMNFSIPMPPQHLV